MCALAELMHNRGIEVSGSDLEDVFYTDEILKELKIPFHEFFDVSHIKTPDLIVHSAAYSFESNVEMAEARRKGIPVLKFSDAIGAYSANFDSTGITGVHGKTTTTALSGTLLKGTGIPRNIPAKVLVGSAVSNFGGRSTIDLGDKYFIAETCEYQRNFLSFHPKRIILTSVESDHNDFFPLYKDIRDAFFDYGRLLPPDGELIYCADDPGASEVALSLKEEKPGIRLVPYGFSAPGDYRIESYQIRNERIIMRLGLFPFDLTIHVPGKHTALNAAAAIALVSSIVRKEFGDEGNDGWNEERMEGLKNALEGFRGSKRRSEILGEAGGILFMDDYAHHPTEIKTTISGLKEFYPLRRFVISFMSHTYSRTSALFDDFASSFTQADIAFFHKIYSSAREVYHGGLNGRSLYERAREIEGETGDSGGRFFYTEEPDEGFCILKDILKPGDLFITLGAGSNWSLGKKLFDYFSDGGSL